MNQGEVDYLQLCLDVLRYGVNNDKNHNEGGGSSGGGGGSDDGTSDPPPPRTPQQKIDDIVRRLDILRGNTPDVSPDNTLTQNFRIIAQKNEERFQNRQIREREREISNIPKGIVNRRKSTTNFNFPDTPPYTFPQRPVRRNLIPPSYPPSPPPTQFDDNEIEDFPPLSHFLNRLPPEKQVFYFLMELNLKVYLR